MIKIEKLYIRTSYREGPTFRRFHLGSLPHRIVQQPGEYARTQRGEQASGESAGDEDERHPRGGSGTVLGRTPRARVTGFGWLPVPFVLAGTQLVAILPERMARLAVRVAPLAVIEPPFGLVELVEAAYRHPSRTDDPAVRWLPSALR
jgi:DNA-binding transcriptional LysR family regulator